MEDRSNGTQVEHRHFSAPWKQQTLKINQKYQFHSAYRLKSIYLALRNGLPAIAMNKACLFHHSSRQIASSAHIKLHEKGQSRSLMSVEAPWKRCLISQTWKGTLITQLRALKFMPTPTTGQAEPEDLVLTNHTLLMQ